MIVTSQLEAPEVFSDLLEICHSSGAILTGQLLKNEMPKQARVLLLRSHSGHNYFA